ncbi:hypothetical protein [uncultured Methylobacterium sp.]|uniref:hypothetical protein n=1 Tax=uncultured Methylobacterium sp. TaxID=157278 RepID=UPI0026086FAD|nr:hypothetical protein [uncultured Methylobacterium sp.]
MGTNTDETTREDGMRSGFGCDDCGSPAVRLPAILHDEAPIQCDRCGCTLMAWGAFKRRVEAEALPEGGPAVDLIRAPGLLEAAS